MTAAGLSTARARWADASWRATATIGLVLLAALLLGLTASGDSARVLALALVGAGTTLLAVVLGPGVARRLRTPRGRSLLLVSPLLVVLLAMLVAVRADGSSRGLLLLVTLATLLFGLVLIGDDLRDRARRAGDRAQRTPWQRMTTSERVRWLPWRAIAGALLVGWSALLALLVLGPYLASSGVLLMLLVVFVGLLALAVVAAPVVVGVVARGDRDRVGRAREDERQRVAAHLHDSVLQTLALVQRQAGDPAAVARLARHQERALRAWMAGEAELTTATLARALHDAVEEVEAQETVEVDVTVLGDRPLDDAGGALVAAAREALRNAARHAPGAPVVVFAELSGSGAAVYVRDEGDGFDPDAVAPERRGVRDAIVGRMAGVGGAATIESARGEGTEVALRLGDAVR